MPVPRGAAVRVACVVAIAVCTAAASCTTYQATPAPTYIGPSPRVAAGPPAGAPPASAPAAGQPATPPPAPAKSDAAPAAAPPAPAAEPIRIDVSRAILTAVANNQALVVERFNTPITRTFEDQERAVFDPTVTATLQRSRNVTKAPGLGGLQTATGEGGAGEVGVAQFLPTGTQVGLTAATDVEPHAFDGNDFFASRLGLTVTQALLRGFGMDVNLASLRQARLDTLSSEYELRGFAESLVAQVEEAYWDYALAQRKIEIYTQSLQVAQQQLAETDERIRIGKLAEIDRAASEAEVALRNEELIFARSTLAETRLLLLRLLNPSVPDYWQRDVVIETPPVVPDVTLEDIASHVQVALRLRPDLNQARLLVERGDLELVKTRNGLLPKMDLFLTLGKSGYADSFGESWQKIGRKGYDVLVGMDFEYPPANRDARARNQRAVLTRQQAAESVDNVAQLVQLDVRTAYVLYNRAKEEVAATAVTRKFQAEKARAEIEKFRVGKSTTLLVAQAQRDLLASQITEVVAVIATVKALVEFYRLEGSLLQRRGIACPGDKPVEMPATRP